MAVRISKVQYRDDIGLVRLKYCCILSRIEQENALSRDPVALVK